MYTLKSNNNKHVLLENNDIKIELITKLVPYNMNDTGAPDESHYIDVSPIKNKYDVLLLNLYFTDPGYGENKIMGNCLYPVTLFDGAPLSTDYHDTGFMSVEYVSADSVTPGNALKYKISLVKTGPNRAIACCTADDICGSLYGIKL